jgi:hypothetical protein
MIEDFVLKSSIKTSKNKKDPNKGVDEMQKLMGNLGHEFSVHDIQRMYIEQRRKAKTAKFEQLKKEVDDLMVQFLEDKSKIEKMTEYIGYKPNFRTRSISPRYKLRNGETVKAKIDSFWPGMRPRSSSLRNVKSQSLSSDRMTSPQNRTNSASNKSLFS